ALFHVQQNRPNVLQQRYREPEEDDHAGDAKLSQYFPQAAFGGETDYFRAPSEMLRALASGARPRSENPVALQHPSEGIHRHLKDAVGSLSLNIRATLIVCRHIGIRIGWRKIQKGSDTYHRNGRQGVG